MLCHVKLNNITELSYHLRFKHKDVKSKKYYDDFLRKKNEGICHCGKESSYGGLILGYKKYCSISCRSLSDVYRKNLSTGISGSQKYKDGREKYKRTCMDRYGVENTFQLTEKISNTFKEKYDCDWINKSNHFREVMIDKGIWVSVEDKNDWDLYKLNVWRKTKLNMNQLFMNWNGYCHYSGLYIKDIIEKNNNYHSSIDHKTSIRRGFENDVSII